MSASNLPPWRCPASRGLKRSGAAFAQATGPCRGGSCTAPPYPAGTVEQFSPAARAWKTVSPLTVPRWGLAAASADGTLYAIGGYAKPTSELLAAANSGGVVAGGDRATERYAVETRVVETMTPGFDNSW